MKKASILLVIALMSISGIIVYANQTGFVGAALEASNYDSFARCLTNSGAIILGTSSCTDCLAQKKTFGQSWDIVNYVDCSMPTLEKPKICQNLQAYPTWKFSNGSQYTGKLSLEQLSQITGCQI